MDSFTEGATYNRPFKFLKKNGGRLPKLSTLEMGSKANSGANKPKETRANQQKKAAVKESSTSQKKQGRKRKRQSRSKPTISDSESDFDPSFELNDEAPPDQPKRRKSTRASATKKSTAEIPKVESDGTADATTVQKSLPADAPPISVKRKTLPGSLTGQILAADRRITQSLASSLFLQTKDMVGGTLPNEWSCVNFSPSKVSLQFMIFSAYSLQ